MKSPSRRYTEILICSLIIIALLLNSVKGIPSKTDAEKRKSNVDNYSEILESSPVTDFPTSELELSISARTLAGRNAICVLYIEEDGSSSWKEYKRTEGVLDDRNPDFRTKLVVQYYFSTKQPLKFEIYNFDESDDEGWRKNSLGHAICTLSQIIMGRGVLNLQSVQSTHGSFITISASEVLSSNKQVFFQLGGVDISSGWRGLFSDLYPFIAIYRADKDVSDYILVHKTEVIKENTTDPIWKHFVLSLKVLSDGKYDRSLKFVCLNWSPKGDPKLIGEFVTTVNELMQGAFRFPLTTPETKNGRNYGIIEVQIFKVLKNRSFVDFIMGGLSIHTFVGIDYSLRNGKIGDPLSLHYTKSGSLNPYERAISSIISVMEEYDEERRFPVYGFPVIIPVRYNRRSYPSATSTWYQKRFKVNLDRFNPVCIGTDGILKAYRKSFANVELCYQPDFAPFLDKARKLIVQIKNYNAFYVALTLMTGEEKDNRVIESIKQASPLPLEIVIVGMGNNDFKDLRKFESIDRLSREIVKFVPFNKFGSRNDSKLKMSHLAKEALANIPGHLVTCMLRTNSKPGPRLLPESKHPPLNE